MRLLYVWYVLLKIYWLRIFAASVSYVILIILLPAGYTDAQRIAARRSYLEGLVARVGDPVLWKRTLIGAFAFAILMAVVVILVTYVPTDAGSLRRLLQRKGSEKRSNSDDKH
jgi:hypothetical protein